MGPLAFAFDISLGVAKLHMPHQPYFLKDISKFKVSLGYALIVGVCSINDKAYNK